MLSLLETVKMRFIAEPGTEPALWATWNAVCDRIQKRALKARPIPKSFEVHHECEVARKALLEAFAAGNTLGQVEYAALASIKLED